MNEICIKMGLKDRLLLITKELKLSGRAFEKECNLTKGAFAGFGDGVGADNLRKIFIKYPQFSANWLLTGEGDMFLNDSAQNAGTITSDVGIMKEYIDDLRKQLSDKDEYIKRLLDLLDKADGKLPDTSSAVTVIGRHDAQTPPQQIQKRL